MNSTNPSIKRNHRCGKVSTGLLAFIITVGLLTMVINLIIFTFKINNKSNRQVQLLAEYLYTKSPEELKQDYKEIIKNTSERAKSKIDIDNLRNINNRYLRYTLKTNKLEYTDYYSATITSLQDVIDNKDIVYYMLYKSGNLNYDYMTYLNKAIKDNKNIKLTYVNYILSNKDSDIALNLQMLVILNNKEIIDFIEIVEGETVIPNANIEDV